MKLNTERGKYFAAWPTKDTLHFTSDDQCFFTRKAAADHARNLKDKNVDTITRAEYAAANPGATPAAPVVTLTPLEQAQQAAAKAEADVNAAQAALAKLPKNAAKEKKEAAAKLVADSVAALEAANAKVAELTPGE